MVFNQNNDIENRIITEFVTSGQDKTSQALDNIRAKAEGVRQRAIAANDAFALWEAQGRRLERSINLRSIETELAKAATSGKNLESALAKANAELIKLQANSAESQSVISGAFAQAAQAGGGRGAAIRRLGVNLRTQLPSIPIAGTSTDQLARLVQGVGLLGAAAVPAGVAVAAVGVALVALKTNTDAVIKATEEDIKVNRELNELRVTGTKKAIEGELEALRIRQQITELNLADESAAFAEAFEALSEGSSFGNTIQFLASALNLAEGEFTATQKAALESYVELRQLNKEIGVYEEALGLSEVATRDAIQAARELAEARQQEFDSAQTDKLRTLLQNVTEDNLEQFDAQTALLQAQKDALADFIEEENLSEEQTKRLTAQYVELHRAVAIRQGQLREEVAARDAARVAAEDQKRTLEETAKATRDYQEAVKKLDEDTTNARLDIEQDYADKIVDLTRKYTSDIEKATVNLQRKQEDLARDLGRDATQADREARFERLQEQIEFNQQTAKQSRELERELARIRDDAANQELDLIRNRDFAGLERLNRDRDRALDNAVDNFNIEQREREIAFRQQQELTNQQLEFDAETRRIRFEQEIEDARRAYDRQRDDLFKARQQQERLLVESRDRELKIVADTANAKLTLLSKTYSKELELAAQTSAIRQQIMLAERDSMNAYARQFQLAQAAGGGITNSTSFNSTLNVQSGASQQQIQQLIPVFRNVAFGLIQEFFN